MMATSTTTSTSSPRYVCSIDQGTSSTRVMLFDQKGKVISLHQKELSQIYPQPGQVEQDPLEIWETVITCLREGLKDIEVGSIAALGITNQRETTLMWNKYTGKPYHNAIVWNDTRTAALCEHYSNVLCSFTRHTGKDRFRYKTGLPLSTYFSVTKLHYLLETVPNLRKDAETGCVLFGTVDSWLIWKLTNGNVHATDVTNASRTFLFNIHSLKWDPELLTFFNIPKNILPKINSSSELYGHVHQDGQLISCIQGVPITGVLGDQHAALFGQTCFTPGEAKCTYGTGAFLFMNTGTTVVTSNNGLLTTIAYKLGPTARPIYALEGSVAYCGSTIQWLKDNLGIINDVSESETYAATIHDNGGVFFIPAFSGLFAPYWRDDARGLIIGLTAYNTRAHICRAALEASAFQVKEILDCMLVDSKLQALSGVGLKVDGGLTKNSLTMQFQSDILQTPLSRPDVAETTSFGVAMAAGLAVGFWKDLNELTVIWRSANHWVPIMDSNKSNFMCDEWTKAISRSLNWVDKRPPHVPSITAITGSQETLWETKPVVTPKAVAMPVVPKIQRKSIMSFSQKQRKDSFTKISGKEGGGEEGEVEGYDKVDDIITNVLLYSAVFTAGVGLGLIVGINWRRHH